MRFTKLAIVSCLVLCFAMGFAIARYSGGAFGNYFGVSAQTLIRSPLAFWRVQQRGWDSFKALQSTQDHSGTHFHQNVDQFFSLWS